MNVSSPEWGLCRPPSDQSGNPVEILVRFEAEGGDVLLVRIGDDERIGAHSHSHVDGLQSVLHNECSAIKCD